jgi:predicted transcriptional regulator of viral defense system
MNIPKQLRGIKKRAREQLALLIRGTKQSFTIDEAAKILGIDNQIAARILFRFNQNGWVSRIKRGIYIVTPLESSTPDAVIEDSWIIANKLFSPCYIAGWSALEYWHLTEQIFNTTVVITTKKTRKLHVDIKGSKFWLKVSYLNNNLGLKPIWRNDVKVQVSDPSRTIIDILDDPMLAGGIRLVLDALHNYFVSEHKNCDLLIQYAENSKNQTIYKRLGFLLEYLNMQELEFISLCKQKISSGYSKLDPQLKCNKLIKKWHLWVPEDWKENFKGSNL